jgi:hypothetical protein
MVTPSQCATGSASAFGQHDSPTYPTTCPADRCRLGTGKASGTPGFARHQCHPAAEFCSNFLWNTY